MAAAPSLWDRVTSAIEGSKTLVLRTATYQPGERAHIDRVLGAFLQAAGMSALKDKLAYCVHELAGNARKANIKRIFFQDQGLAIRNEAEYARGMQSFRRQLMEGPDYYLERLKASALHIKFHFRKTASGVRITITNNAPLTPAEEARIREKLAVAGRHTCFAEAFEGIDDSTEGAGLGIVMMLFMLKSLGFGPDCFRIRTTAEETVAELVLENVSAEGALSAAPATA